MTSIRKHIIILVLTFLTVGISSFEHKRSQILPTSLKVTVLDDLGNPVLDAEVTLYGSKEDYKAETNPLDQQVTNKKGVVVFKKLDPVRYFILANFGDKSNIGSGVQTDALVEGRINKVNTIIK